MLSANSARVRMLTARIRWVSVHRPDQLNSRSSASDDSRPSLIFETVADAVEGFDGVEVRVDRAELAPDALDVAVDRPVVDVDVVLVGDVEQLVAALHHTWPLGQRFQDQELGDGQSHVLAVPQNFVPGRIHGQSPTLEERGFDLVAGRAG